MRKFNIFGATALLLVILPLSALADNDHGNSNNNERQKVRLELDKRGGFFTGLNSGKKTGWPFHHSFRGTVTAVNSAGFTLNGLNGQTLTVLTADAVIKNVFGGSLALSGIHVNDKVEVKGSVSGTTVTASSVVVVPANTHKAEAFGKVTAISGSAITLQTNNKGIISSVVVNTGANTTFTKDGSTTTIASAQVGSTIKAKGLWDEVLNVFNALKVKIYSSF